MCVSNDKSYVIDLRVSAQHITVSHITYHFKIAWHSMPLTARFTRTSVALLVNVFLFCFELFDLLRVMRPFHM